MSEKSPSLASLSLFFVLYVILGILVIWGLSEALYRLFDYTLEGNATALIVCMFSAMGCGTRYVDKSGGQTPPSGFSWKFALISATLMVLITASAAYVLAYRTGYVQQVIPDFDLNSARDQKIVAGVFAGLWLLFFLMNRVVFAYGARSAVKRNRKLAEKAARQQQSR